MIRVKHLIVALSLSAAVIPASAQYNKSGINAGFFDSSEGSQLNFTNFHLPPLAVLFENAKASHFLLCHRTCQLQLWKGRYVGKQLINL